MSSATSVVEQMLDHAANGRWDRLGEVLAPGFVIVEPNSLPYGGEHHGVDGYVALMQQIGGLFELGFELGSVREIDAETVLLQMRVTFTSRATDRSARLPVMERLAVAAGRVTRSEVFLFDTAALLALLPEAVSHA